MTDQDDRTWKTGTRGDRMLLGRVTAGMDVLASTGISSLELAFDDDVQPGDTMPVRWWCGGSWQGTKVFSEHFPYPAQAVEDLLSRILNGGLCRRCSRTTVVGIEISGFCCFVLEADDVDDPSSYRYRRACEREAAR